MVDKNYINKRLSRRTIKVLTSLKELAELSHYGQMDEVELQKIKTAIDSQLEETCQALRTGRDEICFSLSNEVTETEQT